MQFLEPTRQTLLPLRVIIITAMMMLINARLGARAGSAHNVTVRESECPNNGKLNLSQRKGQLERLEGVRVRERQTRFINQMQWNT